MVINGTLNCLSDTKIVKYGIFVYAIDRYLELLMKHTILIQIQILDSQEMYIMRELTKNTMIMKHATLNIFFITSRQNLDSKKLPVTFINDKFDYFLYNLKGDYRPLFDVKRTVLESVTQKENPRANLFARLLTLIRECVKLIYNYERKWYETR